MRGYDRAYALLLTLIAQTYWILAPMTVSSVSHADLANAIRALSMDAVQAAKSGHPGMPMGMADVVTVLFQNFLKFDPNRPNWPDRDRFVLSAGHGSMLQYSLMYLTGYADMDIEQIKNFRQLGYRTAGHPEFGHARGIETTTGPLGQGLATAVGLALAERMSAARFGDALVDHYTYVIAGDGCLMEGVSHEAVSFAGHKKLSKLIVLWDDNAITIDGKTDISTHDDQRARFEASGWDVQSIDGHDPEAIAAAITKAKRTDTPSLIACKTIIGYGAPNKQGTSATHGAPLGDEEIAATRDALGWPHAPFHVPDDILSAWRDVGARGAAEADAWEDRAANTPEGAALKDAVSGVVPSALDAAILDIKSTFVEEQNGKATRQTSQAVLTAIFDTWDNIIGGSADLTGSNGTLVKGTPVVDAPDYSGRYINYGVREFGMAATMNGLSLHGDFRPYGGTFLVFTDYARPAIRLSALMKQPVVYVMTHDSIGLGEDGPTHQPVEHLAALRAMPNLNVFRPADAVEVAECWQLALNSTDTPSIMALTRQGVPLLRTTHTEQNLCARGAYVLRPANGDAKATVFATGSEVSLAVEAAEKLEADGVPTRVVSVPCWEVFVAQDDAYKAEVLGAYTARVAIEAASPFGWDMFVGSGTVIGLNDFGASAPAKELYAHFGITAEAVVSAVKAQV